MKGTGRRALRAEIVHLVDDPVVAHDRAHEHWSDGLLVLADGKVESCGDAPTLLATLPPNTEIIDYSGKLIVPGFIDAHVHYPQTDIVAAYGEKLLEWLTRYTFPTERRFDDPAYAREVADFFLAELLRNGTTTAAVFATVHPESVDAFFASAQALGARMIAGKVMMDRNCPPDLCDTAETSYEDSKALIERWHQRDRLLYAVTPRFAPTSTERQLELAGRLLDEHDGLYLQSHVAENADEVTWVAELYPWSRSYLDVYDHFGLVRERALYAHCLHLDATDRDRMGATGAAVNGVATRTPRLLSEGDEIEIAFENFRFTQQGLPPGVTIAPMHSAENDEAGRRPTLSSEQLVVEEDNSAGRHSRRVQLLVALVLIVVLALVVRSKAW